MVQLNLRIMNSELSILVDRKIRLLTVSTTPLSCTATIQDAEGCKN